MSLKLNSSGGGSITLQEPSTASNRTLTLPDNTGNLISSADSGTVSQAMLASGVAGNGPAFRAYYNGSAINLTNNVWTKVQLSTEQFDTNSNFDPTTNYRFTPTVAGYYQVSGNVYISAGSFGGANSFCGIYKNGALVVYGSALVQPGVSVVSDLIYFNGSTDYIELYVVAFGTGLQYTSLSGGGTFMAASLVRAA